MTGRDEMLRRVREALGRGQGESLASPSPGGFPTLGPVMPPIAPEELLPNFEAELRNVAGSPHRVASSRELDQVLGAIVKSSSSVVLSRNPLLFRLALDERLRGLGMEVAVWPVTEQGTPTAAEDFRRACFQAEVGITGVDFALAETGSLVLSSATEGSQLASLAPPVHVALYRRSQLVGSLDEVLEQSPLARLEDPGRSIVFVTGTSRTADIEQILIRGVHGPRELHAILVEESCLASAHS